MIRGYTETLDDRLKGVVGPIKLLGLRIEFMPCRNALENLRIEFLYPSEGAAELEQELSKVYTEHLAANFETSSVPPVTQNRRDSVERMVIETGDA
jgi:hypothetical protein